MVDVARLQVEVDTRPVNKAQRDLGKFSKASTTAQRATDNFTSTLNALTRVLGAVGLTVGTQQLIAFGNAALQSARSIRDQSQALGVTAEQFQRLSFAFRLVGADSADVSDALITISDRAEDAKSGMQSFIDDFAMVGIEVDDLRSKSPQQLFNTVANAVAGAETQTQQLAVAARIFGDDLARRLLPLLRRGADGIGALGTQANIASNETVESTARIAEEVAIMSDQIRSSLDNAFLGFASENEAEIRRLFAAILELSATTVENIDNVAGPAGYGLIGRLFFGKGFGKIGLALGTTERMMNELVERFGTGRIEDLESQLIPKTQSRIADLRSEVEELENLGFGDVPAVEHYREQIQHLSEDLAGYRKELDRLRNGGDAGPSLGNSAADALRDAAEATRNGIDMPARAQGGSQADLITGPQNLPHVNLIQDMEFSGVQDSFSGIEKSVQQITDELPTFDKMMLSIGDSVRDVAGTIEDGIGNALEDLIVRGESASDVFKQLARDISAAILRQQVIDPFAQAATTAITGLFPGGGATGGQAASTSQIQNMSFLPGRANGGNVHDGRPYMVGERGPELFVPGQDGRISPNSAMGGGSVTVNIINEGGEQLEQKQTQRRRGPNGEQTIDVMVKSSMERLDSQGQLDGIFRRHGARRQGQR